tara:strand:+ start:1847 stop:2062 length:216 start_codon:yes stop_codon:yes gene_type:complete
MEESLEELLGLSHEIVIALDRESITMTKEEKEHLESARESLAFFMNCGDLDRAILEARNILSKLKKINNEY